MYHTYLYICTSTCGVLCTYIHVCMYCMYVHTYIVNLEGLYLLIEQNGGAFIVI